MMHITNGDSTVRVMQQAGVTGEIVPWRDVLHEGPVPADKSLVEMSVVRARFIADSDWADYERVLRDFHERDTKLAGFRRHERLVLWFEHDLYDQLQLLQILSFLSEQQGTIENVYLVQTDRHLGMYTPDELRPLIGSEKPVTARQLELAARAWRALCAPEPHPWLDLLHQDTSALPYLASAVQRMLEEYPDLANGLSRTQQQALRLLRAGPMPAGRLFSAYQGTEERRFMGDLTFWHYLRQMLDSGPHLIVLPPGRQLTLPVSPDHVLTVTEAGEQVLNAHMHWCDIHRMDRWLGGVHLTVDNLWCWDSANAAVRRR